MPKKVLIALPPAMLEQIDFIAQCENRTRSDLVREALRRYIDNFRRSHTPVRFIDLPQPQPIAAPVVVAEETEAPRDFALPTRERTPSLYS